MTELLEAWRAWVQSGASGHLPGDQALLHAEDKLCTINSWEGFVASDEWAGKTDRVHLGLLPVPYIGSLSTARVFLLLLNPGFSPLDYFAEYRVPESRTMAFDCLMQNEASDRRGFYCLHPEISWSGGFQYWHSKLLRLVEELATRRGMSLSEAFAVARRNLAAVELFPYHSARYGLQNRLARQLRSVQLARRHVHEVILPKAARGEATVIVMRKFKEWGVEPSERVIIYEAGEARGAHLGPGTRGGRAILAQLLGEDCHFPEQ